ncbi:hypothetical protein ACUJ8H_37920 [Streptomyces sp. EKR5.2]|uniref:hypothetical protein n=1 Tax=Streptomyces sp. EKR5.2 TaxID=3461014 RepID=UPI00404118FE
MAFLVLSQRAGVGDDASSDHIRALGEHSAAELKQRWRTPQHVTISPGRIGSIGRAALVLNGLAK